jgi:hypothetical protein
MKMQRWGKMSRHPIYVVTALLVLAGAFPGSEVSAQVKALKDAVVGTWTLVSFDSFNAAGTKVPSIEGDNLKGLLVFTDNGVVSVQMIAQLPKLASNSRLKTTPAEDKAIAHGMLSFFGTYTVDEAGKSISLHVERSSFANQMRGELKRLVTVSGDDLTLQNAGRAAGGKNIVKWRRIK